MPDPDKIFLALKSETRRKILQMLTSEPMYLTQLAFTLDKGQQAILRHLKLLEEAGLLDSDFKDAGQGAPRKYYHIARAVRVEVQISPEMFGVELFDAPKIAIKTPDEFPVLAEIVQECNDLIKVPNSQEKLLTYSSLLKRLFEELKRINIAKSIAEATYNNIRNQIRVISYELIPLRIDQRIVRTLASRGGALSIDDLILVLHLTEETLKARLNILEEKKIIRADKTTVYLL